MSNQQAESLNFKTLSAVLTMLLVLTTMAAVIFYFTAAPPQQTSQNPALADYQFALHTISLDYPTIQTAALPNATIMAPMSNQSFFFTVGSSPVRVTLIYQTPQNLMMNVTEPGVSFIPVKTIFGTTRWQTTTLTLPINATSIVTFFNNCSTCTANASIGYVVMAR